MKAVVLRINPKVKFVDITHEISSYSILEASYIVKTVYSYFPEYTVFIIVVDPGVGSERNLLVVKTKNNYFFIGPDNGIFYNALNLQEISECIKIENDKYFLKPVSTTFHGRDIMAPVGGHITKGVALQNFGPKFDPKNFVKVPIDYEILQNEKKIRCTIQYIDSFGNGITNILIENKFVKGTVLSLKEGASLKLLINKKEYCGKFVSHFASVSIGSMLFIKGSSNYLEISINQGNAAKDIGFKIGDIITIAL